MFNIRYKSRNSIKGQILGRLCGRIHTCTKGLRRGMPSFSFVDSTSNARGSGAKIIMMSLEGLQLEKSLRLGFQTSNNEAEYKALIT